MSKDKTLSAAKSASNDVAQHAYSHLPSGIATNETATVGALSLDIFRSVDPYGRVASLTRDGTSDEIVHDSSNGVVAAVSNAEVSVVYTYTGDLLDAGYNLALAGGMRFTRELIHSGNYLRENVYAVHNASPVTTNSFAYGYDYLHRPVSRSGDTFAYNSRGEVTNATIAANASAYAYDGIGNLSESSVATGGLPAVATSYYANSLNQYESIWSAVGNAWLEHSENGELTRLGDRGFLYDAKSRLVCAGVWFFDEERYYAGDFTDYDELYSFEFVVSNRYDHLDRRVQKVTPAATHTYFYDGWMLIKETVANTNGTTDVIEYHWGKDLSGTIGGAGGVGGLLYLTISNSSTPNSSTPQLYVPWYDAYGNVMGYWDAQGNVVAEYTYDAFGKLISSSGPMAGIFSFRYSTKYFDPETGFYYYGYRYYSPELMRWITRDPIGEEGGVNLYAMCCNASISNFDILGRAAASVVVEGLGAGWAGTMVTLNGKTAVRLNNELYYLTMTQPIGTRVPLNGSTTALYLFKDGNPKRALRIDYHKFPLNSPNPPYWHVNVDGGGIARVANSSKLNHTTSTKIRATGKMLTVFKQGGRICFIAGISMSAIDIYKAESRVRESARQVVGWSGAYVGGRIGSAVGAKAGMATAVALGQAGPQVTTPEEVVTVPVFGVIGGIGGGIVGGIGGFVFGAKITEKVYDWAFTPLEKEEWEVGCEY